MSTFPQLEGSVEGSRPAELYRMVIGSEEFFYTSSEDELTVDGDVYVPVRGLRRSTVAQGRDDRNRQLEITLPADNAFADKWKVRPPGLAGSVSVIRVQRDEVPPFNTQTLVFKGIVRGVQFPEDGREARMGVSSIEATAQRPIPRFTYTSQCNHLLYDSKCGVNPDLHKFSGTVSVESGTQITVPGISLFSTKFTAGFVVPQSFTDFRTIRSQVGDVLTLKVPFATSVLNQTVDCFKGCDHLIAGDCDQEFDNVINFGGFPDVPAKNPFTAGL